MLVTVNAHGAKTFRISNHDFIPGWELCYCWTCDELCDCMFVSVCMWLSSLKPCPLFVPRDTGASCEQSFSTIIFKTVKRACIIISHNTGSYSHAPLLPFYTGCLFVSAASSLLAIHLGIVVQMRRWDRLSSVPSLANSFITHSYHEHCQVFSHGAILFHEWLACDHTPESSLSYLKTTTV